MTIMSKSDSISMGELEALLMAQEEMTEKFGNREGSFQANLIQANPQFRKNDGRSNGSGFRCQTFSSRGNGKSGKGGRRGRSNKPICQVYGKSGHIALDYWHRYDEQFASQNTQSNAAHQFQSHPFQSQPNTPRPRASLLISNAIATLATLYDPNWYPDIL